MKMRWRVEKWSLFFSVESLPVVLRVIPTPSHVGLRRHWFINVSVAYIFLISFISLGFDNLNYRRRPIAFLDLNRG